MEDGRAPLLAENHPPAGQVAESLDQPSADHGEGGNEQKMEKRIDWIDLPETLVLHAQKKIKVLSFFLLILEKAQNPCDFFGLL
jgi:hypothetical protein